VAIDLGIRWARQFDAMLVGLGVVDLPSIEQIELLAIVRTPKTHFASAPGGRTLAAE